MLYKLGKVVSKSKSYLIFESNSTGFVVHVYNVDQFELDKFQKVFIYEHKNEYVHTYYGFKEFKERLFFEDLLTIQGIGPKTAMSILSNGWKKVWEFITDGDFESLAKLQYVGIKSAKQIILEFQNKYKSIMNKKPTSKNKMEVLNALKTLGFQDSQISPIVDKLKEKDDIDLMIQEAIELISNEQQSNIIKAN